MTLDLTKPIQTHDGLEARVLAVDLPGEWPICIAVKIATGWSADTYDYDTAAAEFRNVPSAQEWRWKHAGGEVGNDTFPTAELARHYFRGLDAGEPVRILREGETP